MDVITVTYLISRNPLKGNLDFIREFGNEAMLLLTNSFVFALALMDRFNYTDFNLRSGIGWSILVVVLCLYLWNSVVSVIEMYQRVKQRIRNRLSRGKKTPTGVDESIEIKISEVPNIPLNTLIPRFRTHFLSDELVMSAIEFRNWENNEIREDDVMLSADLILNKRTAKKDDGFDENGLIGQPGAKNDTNSNKWILGSKQGDRVTVNANSVTKRILNGNEDVVSKESKKRSGLNDTNSVNEENSNWNHTLKKEKKNNLPNLESRSSPVGSSRLNNYENDNKDANNNHSNPTVITDTNKIKPNDDHVGDQLLGSNGASSNPILRTNKSSPQIDLQPRFKDSISSLKHSSFHIKNLPKSSVNGDQGVNYSNQLPMAQGEDIQTDIIQSKESKASRYQQISIISYLDPESDGQISKEDLDRKES
ncbi:unnamed protein product [Sphagnum balticum]